jgi:hypothetical protein
MEISAIDIVLFAPLAPIFGVLLFWFIQLLFIESQKYLIDKIRAKHEPFCRFTNFLGILFQTICHALGYTVTKSGISGFYISVNYGKVAPKKEKKGIFEWIANAFLFIGPFFIPAFLILLCLFVLLTEGFDTTIPTHLLGTQYTFAGQLTAFGSNLYSFSANFFAFLFNIDLLNPGHLGFLIFLIFLGLGIRPSYIGEKKVDKVDMIYDLKNIWHLISSKPIYVLILFLASYLFFYISFYLNQGFYSILFSIFGWLSIISIVSLILSHLVIFFIYNLDKINGKKKILPYLTILTSYLLMRVFFYYIKSDFDLSLSLFVMFLSTILITYLCIDSKDDKFKTLRKIKRRKTKRKKKNE